MSFLSDFAGSFLQLAGQEGMRRSEEERQLRLREALERRRRKSDYEFQQATNPTLPQPYGPVTQRGPGNFVQQTRDYVPASFDDEGNILSEATWKPGADMPAQDPNALTPWQAEQVRQRELDRAQREASSAERAAALRARGNGGGMTEYQRETLEERRKNRERLERNGSGNGGMTEKGWREGFDQTLTSIQDAAPGKLKSIIRQYGGDSIMTDNMDDEMLREAAYSVAETYWNQRKPSQGKKQGDSQGDDAGKAPQPPKGAKDGQVYEDDNGKRWRVSGGKMVPA